MTDQWKVFYHPYVHQVNERIQQICRSLGIDVIFRSSNTLRQSLEQVKNLILPEKKEGVVHELWSQHFNLIIQINELSTISLVSLKKIYGVKHLDQKLLLFAKNNILIM